MSEFQVQRRQFTRARLVDASPRPAIDEGEILTRVQQFAFTANNVTYAVAGDMLGYWQFFPPGDDPQHEWGLIPVWGFAEVIESRAPDVAVGERLFGYFPPADFLVMQPVAVGEQRLQDGAPHRADLPAVYNSYARVDHEPDHDPAHDALRMLLWPLYVTAFLIADQLRDNGWYGAERIIILSASSKTGIGLAYALSLYDDAPEITGLTSARNLGFVERLQLCNPVTSYEALEGIAAQTPSVIVDMSGDAELNARLKNHLGDSLKYTVRVGLTHWDVADGDSPNDATREFFFAPARIKKRMQDWGPTGFARATREFMAGAMRHANGWLQVDRLDGLDVLTRVYPDICAGNIAPDRGLVIDIKADI